jgi:hypothetical protein
MEPIRRERIPVYLEEEFLHPALRSIPVRAAGALCAVTGVVLGPVLGVLDSVSLVSLVGFLPEALVRLQMLGRRAALGVQRSES